MYGNNDNLLIYTYFTTAFLTELHALDFLNSEYYQTARFQDKFLHENFPKWGGIENPGMFLMALYAMLVVPRQLIEDAFPDEFAELNPLIEQLKTKVNSTYSGEEEENKVDYIRHIRNAVAHARVDFSAKDAIVFRDKDSRRGYECEIEISTTKIGRLMEKLQKVFLLYAEKVKTGFRA